MKLKIYIKTPARLHLGLLDLHGGLGRIYGGIGVAIGYPNIILEMQPSKTLLIRGEKGSTLKADVEHLLKTYKISDKVTIDVKQAIPEHVGLGSGTQLALAIATALAKIYQLKVTTRDLAIVMRRGTVSGIGTAIFEHGGFVIDGGLRTGIRSLVKENFPPLIFHHSFPEDWAFVVAIPNVRRGLSDEEELSAFKQLPSASEEDVGKVCRLVLEKLLPSLIEPDIENFGNALTQIQNIVGRYFAGVQGGTYSSSVATECIKHMAEYGAFGVGQSSWGPAVYGLVNNEKQALKLKSRVQTFLDEKTSGKVFISKANNGGAHIRLVED